MQELTDMHCHVLPGVDDGPAAMADTIDVLREAERQRIGTMLVTPHFHPGRYQVDAKLVLGTLRAVQEACREEGIRIRLLPGSECYWYSGLVEELEKGNALTLNGTRFVLVEFDPETIYSVIHGAVRTLGQRGYVPVIAHFERYRCLDGEEERLEELRGDGAMLQLNFDRLLEKDSLFHRNRWLRLTREGYVDFLGSDTHGMKFRPLHAAEAVKRLRAGVEAHIADKLLVQNPALLIR